MRRHGAIARPSRTRRSRRCSRTRSPTRRPWPRRRRPPARAHLPGRGLVARQVDVVAGHRPEPLSPDRREHACDGAVEHRVRCLRRCVAEIDLHRVPLMGAAPPAVGGQPEPLLGAGSDELLELSTGQMPSMRGHPGEQRVDIDPACLVERDPDRRGLVPQYEAQELARGGVTVTGAHRWTLAPRWPRTSYVWTDPGGARQRWSEPRESVRPGCPWFGRSCP